MANNLSGWGDLPVELLLKIASSCPDLQNILRGVCQSWKAGLEANAIQLTISGSAMPPNLGVRFSALAKLDLQGCDPGVTPRALRSLRDVASLTNLALRLKVGGPTREMLEALHGLPLETLTLAMAATEITDASMAALQALNLPRLDLELIRVKMLDGERNLLTDAQLRRLAGLAIKELDLSGSQVTDAGMPALRDLPLLKTLNLSDTFGDSTISDAGVAQLRGLSLTALNLANLSGITDEGLDALRGMPLQTLDMEELVCINNEGLEVLRGMPLTSLNLCCCEGISSLEALRGLPLSYLNLEVLNRVLEEGLEVVRDMPLTDFTFPHAASDLGLGFLRGKPLTKLDLAYDCRCTSARLDEVLTGMPLVKLRAAGTPLLRGETLRGAPLTILESYKFADLDLEALAGMRLVDLELWDCVGVSDHGLRVLGGMPLTRLSISKGINISDAGLEVLRGMSLEVFKLHRCPKVTDFGLKVLLGMPLRVVQVLWCRNTTEQGVKRVTAVAGATSY